MQIVYNIVHFILICALAPWLIGAGYSMCLSNSELSAMAGLAIVVFSFPVTFLLAVVSWVIWRIFAGEINRAGSCFSGLFVWLWDFYCLVCLMLKIIISSCWLE